MLDELIVSNLGIIESAHIEPGTGFVVLTGETGAGKTLLLGALRLLMGAPGRKEAIGPFDSETVVDGRFLFEAGDEATLRRRVTAEGRSKAYSDGSMIPAKALQERLNGRIEVVGQHDHMLLTRAAGPRRLVDSALDGPGREAAAAYAQAWEDLVLVRQKRELLGGSRRELERELEIVHFQADEIGAAGFEPGDDAELQARAIRLRHSEELAAGLGAAMMALGEEAAADQLEVAATELSRLTHVDESLAGLRDRTDEILDDVTELRVDLASVAAELEHDPAELGELERRIHQLGALRRKYGDSLEDVLAYGRRAQQRADELTLLLSTADDVTVELEATTAAATAAAGRLTAARVAAAGRLETDALTHMRELGMPDPILSFRFSDTELGPHGADRVGLVFASDRVLTPRPAAKIASGGELSRLTLALRLAAGVGDAELVAFDEVDAGIGGATALAMGEKLAALGQQRQIFCVTHLPQVAAHADTHFVIERAGARATVRALSGDDRLTELSRMLGGLPDSERGQLHAAELLESAKRS